MSIGNKIKNFLIFCAGSSKEILQKCPSTEWIKHTSTGATVLFTSIIAMLSSFYAFQLIFTAFLPHTLKGESNENYHTLEGRGK